MPLTQDVLHIWKTHPFFLLVILFVHAAGDPNKTDHLLSLRGAKERLQLFEANLMEEGSFDSVVDGCEGVFHTASPCVLQVNNPQVYYDTSIGFSFHYEFAGCVSPYQFGDFK